MYKEKGTNAFDMGSIARYNPAFNQVVTCKMDSYGTVCTWNVETGEAISRFSNAHGNSPVTAMIFDSPARRLLTGSHGGQGLHMWNFSNGARVKEFCKTPAPIVKKEVYGGYKVRSMATLPDDYGVLKSDHEMELPAICTINYSKKVSSSRQEPRRNAVGNVRNRVQQSEVTCILDIEKNVRQGGGEFSSQRIVCSAGWDRVVTVWMDNNEESVAHPICTLPNSNSRGIRHHKDITCMTFVPPIHIATSSLDGQV